jgi:hypothetical protein
MKLMVYPPGTATVTDKPPFVAAVKLAPELRNEKSTKQSVEAYVPVPGDAKPHVVEVFRKVGDPRTLDPACAAGTAVKA